MKNKLNIYGAALVLLLFVVSMVFPEVEVVSKALAIATYATITYIQIMDMKKKGESYEKSLLVSIAFILVFIYIFYFV